jgi:hypothetical protein
MFSGYINKGMTKRDFLSKIPDIINHKTRGYGELEIIVDSKEQKGVCYRHKDTKLQVVELMVQLGMKFLTT